MADALAIIADDHQTDPGYLRRGHHHHRSFNTSVSVNLSHAKVAREKKPPAKCAEPKPAPVEVPAIVPPSIEINGRVLASIDDYDGLWNAVRARIDALKITRLELDHLSGLQEGYNGKLLGPAQKKKFGPMSLGATLGGSGCYLTLIEDEIKTEKIRTIDRIFSAASAALGMTRVEFAHLAGFKPSAPEESMSSLDNTLDKIGCKLALVEDPAATTKIMARCKLRRRPLRPLKPAADKNV